MASIPIASLFNWTKQEVRLILVMTLTIALLLFDTSTLPVALPSLQSDLGSGWPWLQWVINAYFVTMTCGIIASGRLADIFGNRYIFCLSMIIYAFGSLSCSVAYSSGPLIFGRVFQGIGAAMAWPSTMSILTEYFPLSKRGKALGLVTSLSAFLIIIGPIIGGILTQYASWRLLFVVIAGVAIMACVTCRYTVRKAKRLNETFDRFGFFSIILFFLTFTSVAMLSKLFSWMSWEIPLLFCISLAALFGYRYIRRHIQDPMLDLSIFRARSFLGGVLLALCAQICQSALLYWAIFLQKNLLFSPLKAGCVVIFSSIPMLLIAPLSGLISDRTGPKTPVFCGFLCTILGVATIWLYSVQHHFCLFVIALFIYGLGPALYLAPIATYSLSEVPEKKHGVAYAIYNAFRFLGIIFGIAMMGNINNYFRLSWFEEKLIHFPELSTFDPKFIVRGLSWLNREELLPIPKETIEVLRETYYAVSVDALNVMNAIPVASAILGLILATLYLRPYNKRKFTVEQARESTLAEVHW